MNTLIHITLIRICLAIVVLVGLSGRIQYVTAHHSDSSMMIQRSVDSGLIQPVVFTAASDTGKSIDVWLVDTSTAKLLSHLDEAHPDNSFVDCKLSPDTLHVVCWLKYDGSAKTSVSVIDTLTGKRTIVDVVNGEPNKEGRFEEITSAAWLDNKHVIDAKVTWPSNTEIDAARQSGVPYPLKAEVNKVEIGGSDKTTIVTAPVHRVLGVSSDAQNLYVTYLIPGIEDWKIEGFGRLNMSSGQLNNVWPKDKIAHYYAFQLIKLASGKQRVVYVAGQQGPGLTAWAKPPIVYVGDPDTDESHVFMMNEDEKEDNEKGSVYNFPTSIVWSQVNDDDTAYISGGEPVWATPSKGLKIKFGKLEGFEPLALVTDGILGHIGSSVVILSLKDKKPVSLQTDEVVSPLDAHVTHVAVSNYAVPFIHQLYDTKDGFEGDWACGPTSATMALAYFKKIRSDPITVYKQGAHQSLYGKYETDQYSVQAACSGATTFSTTKPDKNNNYFAGAYGTVIAYYSACGGWCSSRETIQSFLNTHDLGTSTGNVTEMQVKAELDGGGIVILGGTMNTYSHIIVIRGYTTDGTYIVNDPYGDGTDRSYDGAAAQYTWSFMNPAWYLAVYGSHYVSDVRNDGYAQSTIAIQNSNGSYGANSEVCLMNSNGTKHASSKSVYAGPNSRYNFSSNDIPSGFWGSAVIRPNQSGVGSVLLNTNPSKIYDFASVRSELVTNESYIPWYACNFNSWNSTLTVQNANTLNESNAVTAYHYNQWGSLVTQQTITLWPWQQNTLSLCSGGGYYGSVKLVGENGKPIAASVVHQHPSVDSIAYEGVSSPASNAHAPSLVKNFANGYQSSLNFQALASNSVNIDYYGAAQYWKSVSVNGSTVAYLPDEPIPAYSWSGAATMNTGYWTWPMAVAEHFASPNGGALGYPLVSTTYPRLIMPRIRTQRSASRDASITILNPSYGSVAVTVYLYWANGALAGGYYFSIQPRSTISLYYEIPDTFDGSGVIKGMNGARVAAVVHESDGSSKSVGYQALPLGNIVP